MSDVFVDTVGLSTAHTSGLHQMYGLDGNDNLNYTDGTPGFVSIYGGSGNDRADGGNDNDLLSGDDGNDVLTGWNGADEIYGGKGDDQLFGFWNTAQFSDAGDGNDSIYGGSGDDQLFGQVGDDFLDGGQGNDLLVGGPGADTMLGGPGADTYLFDQLAVKGMARDIVLDYKPADDSIQLDDAAFAGIGDPGALKGGKFFLGGKAGDAGDRVGYNSKSGALIYDGNGDNQGGKVVFAFLDPGLNVTKADFFVV